ncbi:MAG: alpha/beta fold hydrolase [Candidatus Promineofilum sp.]|nr:alpha/beta fold hydrolase [Promineifilum sp.]
MSIADNATRLARIIDRLTQRYGVDQINLLGHSKGGLDSRGYISDNKLNDDNDVAALITLASPHHGSALADYAADHPKLASLIGYKQTPALKNVSEKDMNETFNPAHPARPACAIIRSPRTQGVPV